MRSLRCSSMLALFAIAMVFQVAAPPAALGQITVPVVVPGWSDPYLAGMPPGSTSCGDTAPAQSPPEVADPCLIAGDPLTFQATGGVARDPYYPLNPPDGDTDGEMRWHDCGDDNGISDMRGPFECLVGVFLDASQPNSSPAPPPLDFGTQASRDYLTLSPLLKQVFYIGDGLTSLGQLQHVLIPAGTTRLYLGTWDSCCWNNNIGHFDVLVTDPCGGTPLGGCCFPDGHCEFLTTDICVELGGVPQGVGTVCEPNPCPQPPMACCFGDGHCEFITAERCGVAGGTPQGYGTDCDPNDCPQTPDTGACCLDDQGHCQVLTEADCVQHGGEYQGNDTTCDPNPCPIVPSESATWGRIKAIFR